MHFAVGVFYDVVFATLLTPVSNWSKITQGAIFGLAITALALAFMPIIVSPMSGGGGSAYAAFTRLVHHVIFGVSLALLYKGNDGSVLNTKEDENAMHPILKNAAMFLFVVVAITVTAFVMEKLDSVDPQGGVVKWGDGIASKNAMDHPVVLVSWYDAFTYAQ